MTIFHQVFDAAFIAVMVKLILSLALGLILGLERVYSHKTVGMRTYGLVTLASTMFIITSIFIGEHFVQFSAGFNPAFIAGNIIVGIGFLGAGLIMHRDGHVENLTSSGGLWACAGVGIMVGFGMIREAIFVSFMIFFILGILSFVERKIRLTFYPDPEFEKTLTKKAAPKRAKKVVTKTISVQEENV